MDIAVIHHANIEYNIFIPETLNYWWPQGNSSLIVQFINAFGPFKAARD